MKPISHTPSDVSTSDAHLRRIAELEAQLDEARETLDAIRSGEVDAVVIGHAGQSRVFTLESADRPYRLLIEQMREGAVTLSVDGLILYCNAAFARLTGEPASQVIGTRFGRFFSASGLPIADILARAGRSEIELLTGNDAPRAVQVSVSALADDDGPLLCAVVTDLTEERLQARELAAANDRLSFEMDERARAEEALRQSQKMEAMGQLTGGVAHDFNNLLTPIVGTLDMLQRRGVGGEREQRLIGGAAQSADRAKTLVQRLLAFARRQPLQTSAVDVGALTRGMADLVSSTTGPQIKVVVDAADDLPAAVADPNQLEMAILNLAVNARDAMPEGGTLRISVSAEEVGSDHPRLRPGPYIRLSVADTGFGMDEATLQRAIEPFFSTKGIGKGTGLGLSMVHGLASQLGGTLLIHSQSGIGTNVEFWLPVSSAPARESGTAEPVPAATSARGTALLVDDEELVRASTADMLMDFGHDVIEAESAEAALRLIDRGLKPDLLVTDHLMPGMTGTELARSLRARLPDMAVLIVSGYADADGIEPDLARLTKPFGSAQLAAAVASAMDHDD